MALVGKAVCDSFWAEIGQRAASLAPALIEYKQVLENCSTQGVVQYAIRDLDLICTAGIEGAEPVFELLEGYINGWTAARLPARRAG